MHLDFIPIIEIRGFEDCSFRGRGRVRGGGEGLPINLFEVRKNESRVFLLSVVLQCTGTKLIESQRTIKLTEGYQGWGTVKAVRDSKAMLKMIRIADPEVSGQ